MASRRRPSALNPFDSSDEEDAVAVSPTAYSNPFDGDKPKTSSSSKPSKPAKPSQSVAATVNPFDDDEGDECRHNRKQCISSSQKIRHRRSLSASNPFDDVENERPSHSTFTPAVTLSRERRHKSSSFSDKNPFDGDEDEQCKLPEHEQNVGRSSRYGKSVVNSLGNVTPQEKAVAKPPRGDVSPLYMSPVLRKMQKLKEAGLSQASRMVEGSFQHAQKLKESSYNAFKSANDGSGKGQLLAQKSSPLPSARSQLLSDGRYDAIQGENHRDYSDLAPEDLQQLTVDELEDCALQKSHETTKTIQNCLNVAVNIKEDAAKTMAALHSQGEKLVHSHEVTVEIDQNLSAGEKLLGTLGGFISRTWKPKKSAPVLGPVSVPGGENLKKKDMLRSALGLDLKEQKNPNSPDFQRQTMKSKIEMERNKQDDALSDLSNVLDQLKEMSIDMGSELSRQSAAVECFQNDVVILDDRVRGANARGRRLLGK